MRDAYGDDTFVAEEVKAEQLRAAEQWDEQLAEMWFHLWETPVGTYDEDPDLLGYYIVD